MNRQNKKFVKQLCADYESIVEVLMPRKDMEMCDGTRLGDCMIPEIDTDDEDLTWALGLEEKYDNLIQGISDVYHEEQDKVDNASEALQDRPCFEAMEDAAMHLEQADELLQWNTTIFDIISRKNEVIQHLNDSVK